MSYLLTKKHLSRRTFLHGVGVTMALPLLDSMIPAATRWGRPRRRHARGSAASTFRTARSCRKWTPAADGRRLRAHPDPAAAEAVLRPDHRRQRPAARPGLRQRRNREPQSSRRRIPERAHCRTRRAAAARCHRRPARRAEYRPGHAAPLARADDRRAEPELRRRSQLLLPRHDLLAGRRRRRCRCRTTRRSSSSGCSATAAPTPSARRAARSR